MIPLPPRLAEVARTQPYPLVFATVSGAHLYGFPSPDSDWDLRGVHVLPPREVLGLTEGEATRTVSETREGLELDLVTHDARKFFTLMLKRNGYVLEQLFSPLVVATSEAHARLKALGGACITKHHAHHYLGFAATQWKLFEKESPRRVKPLLYVYRVLLTGIHLMRTGRIEANLVTLQDTFRLPQVPDLIARKLAGPEASVLPDGDLGFHHAEYARLTARLEGAAAESALPERPRAKAGLNELLLALRGA